MSDETAEGSASSWAMFKEDMPKKMHIGKKIESQSEDTLMGNLAKRIQATRFIRSQPLGAIKAREADKVAGADMSNSPAAQLADCGMDDCPKSMTMSDSYDLKKGMKVEGEHTKDNSMEKKIAEDHLKESPNYYKDWENKEKILFKKSVSNMADQAKEAGNVFETRK